VGRENIFKPTTTNESLHQDSNDNGVTVVNFATSKSSCKDHAVPAPKLSQVHLDLSREKDSKLD